MMKVIMKFAQVVGLLVLVGGVIWLGYWGVTSLRVPKHHHSVETISPREELNRESPIKLEPRAGSDIGFVYEAFLSPHQEGGEEEETPDFFPRHFIPVCHQLLVKIVNLTVIPLFPLRRT